MGVEQIVSEEQMKYIANLMLRVLEQDEEIERLQSIIKEVREYIEDNTYKSNGTEYMDLTGIKELLEILDKENNND